MPLTASQKRHLRGLAHALAPVVTVGQRGVTDGVIAETARTLADHELVKVRFANVERDERAGEIAALAAATGSEVVQRIGRIACLYRRHPDQPRIALPR
jgi:RNA-binding protein